jgi:hypothetical protein
MATVARLVAKLFKTLGVLSRGHLVEVDRSKLVEGYVGQTATKTTAVVESAFDGRFGVKDRDRGEPCGSTPPTPPYVRVRIRRFEKLR